MARLFADVGPLRDHREFRRLWFGFGLSGIGTQLATVTLGYEVYVITRSSLDVGYVSLIQLLPSILGSTLGGAVADALDRRSVLLVTETSMALCALGMGFDARSAHPMLWLLFVLAALNALFGGCDSPAGTALMTSLVPRESYIAANALRLMLNKVSSVVGPAIGGIILAAFGPSRAFFLNAASFVFALAALVTIAARPPAGGGTRIGLRSIAEGFQFLRGKPALQGCFIADLNATILGMPTALFPAIGIAVFHGGARDVGFLYAAPGLGALASSVMSGWTGAVRYPGRAVCACVSVWGAALAAFGLSRSLPLALGFLAIAGGADVISGVFRSTIIQTEAPDRLRGRLTAIQSTVVSSGPRLGNTEAGAVAALAGTQFSVVSGGLGCILGIVIVAKAIPGFLSYELPRQSEAAEETVPA